MRTLDPTCPVIGNDGWESVTTDIIGIHDYDSDPGRMAHRYQTTVSSLTCSARRGRVDARWW